MTRSVLRGLAPALPVLLALGCGGERADGPAPVSISDSAGVRIVQNLGPDRPAPWSSTHVADLVPPDSALTAAPWGVAADPMSGRIYVADRTAPRVVVFDRTGDWVETYGRAGEGPGEFERPTALSVGPYGALTVWDTGRSVLSRWSTEGDLLNERRAPVAHWGPGVYERPGRLVTVALRASSDPVMARQVLIELTPADTVTLHSIPRSTVRMELPCITTAASPLFAPSMVWAPRGDTTYVLNGPGYRIDAFAGGALTASIRRPIEPVPVTRSMAVDRARAEYAGFLRRCGVSAERVVEAVGHEERVSGIPWIEVDPVGRLWVSRSADGLSPERIDVLDTDGRYQGTFDLPVLPVAFVSDARFVGLSVREGTGETVLSLYDLQGAERSGDAVAATGSAGWTPAVDLGIREFRDCAECPVMIELPPGRFFMGAPEGEAPAAGDPTRPDWTERAERPQVEVEIAHRLAIGKYEVTFAEWDRCVAAGGCTHEPDDEGRGRGGRPVTRVSRPDALEFVGWLTEETGRLYRLPSEAEWEYAARAGTSTARYWGDATPGELVACDGCGSRWDEEGTRPVGAFPPNQFGLHDMLGNVDEWVADCWHEDHEGNPGDGSARVESSPWWRDGKCERPVERGGTFRSYPWAVRAAHRDYYWPGPWTARDSDSRGFRVARTVRGSPSR